MKILIISYLIFYLVESTIMDSIKGFLNNYTYLILDAITRSIKLVLDLFMYYLFLKLYIFFFKLKKEKLEEKELKLSTTNYFLFIWGILILLLRFSHSIMAFVTLFDFENKNHFEIVNDRFIIPGFDFLTYFSMMYLFYI